VQVVYGYQDFEPIVQAYWLQARLPNAEVCFINEAAHIPWLEQPDLFYETTRRFLSQ
jgi:pimeloyl-ACP methyl ester carboxylesterase